MYKHSIYMKSILSKLCASLLITSFVTSNILFALPDRAEAQAGAAASCTAGYLAAMTASAPAWVQNAIGVPKSQIGDTTQNIVTSGSTNSLSFNNCILKPLGQALIISIIRNIGASVVDWVNSGFEGKPSFITDFGGTLLNAADQAVGRFIEGADLGFLCNDFSFQIRIALALKYSKPTREEFRCTFSALRDNANNFIENNGGAGWDNWLSLTTKPNNNVYGAYLIADSELAQRALNATGLEDKKITIGQGFRGFETCDAWETPAEVQTRLSTSAGGSATFSSNSGNSNSFENFDTGVEQVDFGNGAVNIPSSNSFQTPNFDTNQTIPSQTVQSVGSSDPQCVRTSVKTPGRIIAGKLDSVLGQGEIQAAVADEIDEVIAATLNQLAQMAIQGAGGLLGLSKKSSYSSASAYADRYRAQYYGEKARTSSTGASSELESYRVINYEDGVALVNDPNNSNLQDIQNLVNSTVTAASNQQVQQITSVTENNDKSTTTINAALLKRSYQSSGSNAGGANDGIRNTTKYLKGSTTGTKDANAWWEVDLGEPTVIQSVNVWRVDGKDEENTLGTFRVTVKNSESDSWTSDSLDGAVVSEPIVVPVNRTGRYVRIDKNAKAYNCGNSRIPETCYRPLELAEVQVISPVDVNAPVVNATTTSQTVTASTTASISIQVPSSTQRVKSLESITVNVPINASASTVIPRLEVSITANNKPIRFDSVLSDPKILIKKSGITNEFSVSADANLAFSNIPAGGTYNTTVGLTGAGVILQRGTAYQLRITSKNSSNATTSTGTVNFVVE